MILTIFSLCAIAALIIGGLALIDGAGVPSKENARTGTAGQTLADSLVTPEPLTDSFSGILGKMLAEYEGEAVIVIDPQTRRVVGTTDATKATAIKAAVNAGTGKQYVLTPDANQTGKALAWTGAEGVNFETATDEWVKGALDGIWPAVKPRRSVESMVSAILGLVGKDLTGGGDIAFENGTFIVIDQVNKSVTVQAPADSAPLSAALAAVAPSTTDMAAVELSADAAGEESNPPVFEGGATS